MLVRSIGYAVPGMGLVLFALLSKERFSRQSACIYGYIAGYAAPYLFIAVMYRYSFPLITLSSILIGSLMKELRMRPSGLRA